MSCCGYNLIEQTLCHILEPMHRCPRAGTHASKTLSAPRGRHPGDACRCVNVTIALRLVDTICFGHRPAGRSGAYTALQWGARLVGHECPRLTHWLHSVGVAPEWFEVQMLAGLLHLPSLLQTPSAL
jgi:hypothetical protein